MLKNQRDPEATKAAGFLNRKSYRSFAGHWYVVGEADHYQMRVRVFAQARGLCQTCPEPHFVPWGKGEWHHAQKTYGGKRCDGPCCGQWSCKAGHPKKLVQWTPKESHEPAQK